MKLNEITINDGARKSRKRVGRGTGSGHGKTSTRGGKGLTARSGAHNRVGYEGGQMPKMRRMPKRGFRNTPFQKMFYQIVNVQDLNRIELTTQISNQELVDAGLIKHVDGLVKILAKGELTRKIDIIADAYSESAQQKITALGGTAVLRGTQTK
jgi:large subunit ribosomal protein L15